MGKLFACRQSKCVPENTGKLVYNSFLGQCTIQADKVHGSPTECKLVEKRTKNISPTLGGAEEHFQKINAR